MKMYLKLPLFLSFFFCFVHASYAEAIDIFGTLKNGTTNSLGNADSIKLIALQGAMLPIADLGPQKGSFRFSGVDVPEGAPLLVQVTYKGVNYNKMIPPTPAFRSQNQEVVVYETTESKEKVSIKSLMQVIREKKGIRIFKLFLIDNQSNPKRSYYSKENPIEFFVPKQSTESYAQVQQPGSRMAIPLNMPEGKNGGKLFDRAALPGISELQVSYFFPGEQDVLEEKLLAEGQGGSYPIFLKPADMQMEVVDGGTLVKLDKEIPAGLSAVAITANSDTNTFHFRLKGGKPVPTALNGNPEIQNGTILTTWDTSLFAVIGFIALLFTLSFLFVYRK
ncbi:hypothetical protein LPTSP4_32790 [Leptospira ryugenii]|uniref:Uncharacterized protein n=1 Tax=Leptospira ryugenii TaxID=1917863 RepID=A0A2P2E4D7_9LEPT|nr:hypothetical protein [Leptospira ryugenii]GBF51741.1 hypothetical protein LPTSP4_32790 [Leptospira ryugenii]